MTTIGKVCLWLTVIGLGVISVYLLPAVGKKHNDISASLRTSKETVDKAVEAHRKTTRDLAQRRALLARQQIGWDKSWTIDQQGQDFGVQVDNDRLVVSGLGTDAGLEPVLDEAGQPSPPAVHAFRMMPEGGMFYVGEFQAAQLEATLTVLVPIWLPEQDELDEWARNQELPWRFRTLVPAGKRLHIDRLHGQLQKLNEDQSATLANVDQQEQLLKLAEDQLEIRKQELLGNPNVDPIPERPEYSDGLIRAIASEEERRNDLQVEIDELRRLIHQAAQERTERIERLREYPELFPQNEDAASDDKDRLTRFSSEVQ